jgi:uncharacterized oligopeptide transporter (OPT) family protein
MVLGGITEAGLWQSAVLMSDLKSAYLAQTSPKVMFHAQILGSVVGAFVGSGIYRLFTVAYNIPSEHFPVPLAFLWANTARLVNGGDLPQGVGATSIAAFFLSGGLRLLRLVAGEKGWRNWVPSGIAMSIGNDSLVIPYPDAATARTNLLIGMFVPPSITLAKFIGAGLRIYCTRRWGASEIVLMSAAAGCILGEGTLGFIPLIMERMGVPRLL